jgi:hypothetical protein
VGAIVEGVRLGEYLVGQGVISVEQLEDALRSQVMYGARLGTNLIEQGAILDLDVLAQALAALAGVPPALARHLENADRAAIALVPAKVAAKWTAVPLGFTRGAVRRLAVAFVDPLKPHAADEIGMVTGISVLPSVACELRVHYHLERIYGIPRHNRYVRVDEAAARHRDADERRRFVDAFPSISIAEVVAPRPAPAPEPPPAPVAAKPTPAPARHMSGAWDIVLPPPKPAPKPLPSPPPAAAAAAPADAAATAAAIAAATDRDTIGDLLAEHLRRATGGGLVLIVRQGMALGWKGVAPGVESAVIEAVALPLGQPSMLQAANASGALFRGAPAADGAMLNGLLWKLLKTPPPAEVVVVPIAINGRVINLLYAHPPGGGRFSDATVAELATVGAAAAAAFARLIQAAKAPRP